MKKILVVETNTTNFPNTNQLTGLWLGESAEFVAVMQQAGYTLDYVSPKGHYIPIDPRSMKSSYIDQDTLKMYQDSDYQVRGLSNTLQPDDIQSKDYAAIYYTGGHGVMWDFPHNTQLQKLSLAIYQNGGYLCSVCHGIAGLLNIKLSDGKYLIAGKNITGFTNTEELLSGNYKKVPFLNEKVAKKHGANFKKGRPFASHVIKDGRIITGQNPQSPKAVADELIKAMDN